MTFAESMGELNRAARDLRDVALSHLLALFRSRRPHLRLDSGLDKSLGVVEGLDCDLTPYHRAIEEYLDALMAELVRLEHEEQTRAMLDEVFAPWSGPNPDKPF